MLGHGYEKQMVLDITKITCVLKCKLNLSGRFFFLQSITTAHATLSVLFKQLPANYQFDIKKVKSESSSIYVFYFYFFTSNCTFATQDLVA